LCDYVNLALSCEKKSCFILNRLRTDMAWSELPCPPGGTARKNSSWAVSWAVPLPRGTHLALHGQHNDNTTRCKYDTGMMAIYNNGLRASDRPKLVLAAQMNYPLTPQVSHVAWACMQTAPSGPSSALTYLRKSPISFIFINKIRY